MPQLICSKLVKSLWIVGTIQFLLRRFRSNLVCQLNYQDKLVITWCSQTRPWKLPFTSHIRSHPSHLDLSPHTSPLTLNTLQLTFHLSHFSLDFKLHKWSRLLGRGLACCDCSALSWGVLSNLRSSKFNGVWLDLMPTDHNLRIWFLNRNGYVLQLLLYVCKYRGTDRQDTFVARVALQ